MDKKEALKIAEKENLISDYYKCEVLTARCGFLEGDEERIYFIALFNAIRWAKSTELK